MSFINKGKQPSYIFGSESQSIFGRSPSSSTPLKSVFEFKPASATPLTSPFPSNAVNLSTLDEMYGIYRTTLQHAIMMDLSTIGFQEYNMNSCAKSIIEKLKYHPMIKIKGRGKLEIGFKNEEDRESALNQEWEVNGYKVEAYKAWHISEIIMRLTVSNFGNQFIGKELEEKLRARFSIYGKVISCTQALDNEKIYYTDSAVVFLIPNDDVLFNRLAIPNKFLVSKDLPLAICIYEPPEVKCIHCGKNDHKSIQCETTQGFESLFISTEDNSNGYVEIDNNE